MAIKIKIKNSVTQNAVPTGTHLPEVGELAVNANINSIGGYMRASDNSIVKIFGPGSLSTPAASTTVSGIAELATSAETTTGTDTARVCTPAGVKAVTDAERTTSNSTYLALSGGTLVGVLQVTAGSNSAPAIHFGDSDSGIYGGTNTVSLAAGGNQGLTLGSTGKASCPLGLDIGGSSSIYNFAVKLATDKHIAFSPNQGELGSVPALVAYDDSGSLEDIGFRGTTVRFAYSGAEAGRFDSSGRLLVGLTSARTFLTGYTPSLQVEGTANSDSAFGIVENISATSGPSFWFGKTRSASLGGVTSVQDGDDLGTIVFNGADGTDLECMAAWIRGKASGTIAGDRMPGILEFATTADSAGSVSPTTRLTIGSDGNSSFAGNVSVRNTGGVSIFNLIDSDNECTHEFATPGNGDLKITVDKNDVATGQEFLIYMRGDASGDLALKIDHDGHTHLYGGATTAKLETTSTGAKTTGVLEVTGNIEARGAADVKLYLGSTGDTSANDNVHLRADAGHLKLNSADGKNIYFEEGGTELLNLAHTTGNATFAGAIENTGGVTHNLSSGNVQAMFPGGSQVNGVTALPSQVGTPFIVAKDTGTGKSANFAGTVLFGGAGSYVGSNVLRFSPAGTAYIDHGTTGQAVHFRVSNSSALDTNALVIKSDGKIGIGGVTSPVDKLNVAGAVRINQSNTLDHLCNAGTVLEVRGDGIGAGVVDTDFFKGFKIALNDGPEYGGQAQFAVGRWEENATNARSSLMISLGHGGISSSSDADADVLMLTSDKHAEFFGGLTVDGTTLFVDAANNRCGIGTTSPANLLSLESSAPVLSIRDTASYSAYTNGGKIYFQGTDSDGAVKTFAGVLGVSQSSNNGQLKLQTRSSGTLYDRLIIDASGKVNIGNTTPSSGAQLSITNMGLNIKGQNLAHEANSLRIGEEGSGKGQLRAYGPDSSNYGKLEINLSASDGSGTINKVEFERASGGIVLAFPDGGGIDFGASESSHSSDSSILADYEKGRWTSTVSWSDSISTTGTVTATSSLTGYFIKIDKLVWISLEVTPSTHNGGDTCIIISCTLPFTPDVGGSAMGLRTYSGTVVYGSEMSGPFNFYGNVSTGGLVHATGAELKGGSGFWGHKTGTTNANGTFTGCYRTAA